MWSRTDFSRRDTQEKASIISGESNVCPLSLRILEQCNTLRLSRVSWPICSARCRVESWSKVSLPSPLLSPEIGRWIDWLKYLFKKRRALLDIQWVVCVCERERERERVHHDFDVQPQFASHFFNVPTPTLLSELANYTLVHPSIWMLNQASQLCTIFKGLSLF